MTTPSYQSLLRSYIDTDDTLNKWIIALQLGNILSLNNQTIPDEDRRTIQQIYDKERHVVIRPREPRASPQVLEHHPEAILQQEPQSSTGEILKNVCYIQPSATEKSAAGVRTARHNGRDRMPTSKGGSAKSVEGFTQLESSR